MKLVKIVPDKIQIRTDDAEFVNARLNDLISVSDGEVELVTQICAITANDVETQMDDNAIMVYVNRLRGKIEANRQKPVHIVTVRGLGYRFMA